MQMKDSEGNFINFYQNTAVTESTTFCLSEVAIPEIYKPVFSYFHLYVNYIN